MDAIPRATAGIGDQHGKTAVVTGATSGLGRQVASALASAGATVILACRDVARARVAAASMRGDTHVIRLDLADLSSVQEFARCLDGDIDILVNNAGVMGVAKGTTSDGFERHIGTNHLGHFALTGLLAHRVRARIVTVTSGLHALGRIRDDLNWQRGPYSRWLAYAQSKLANLLFAYELDRRLSAAGRQTVSIAAHPGLAATEGQGRDKSLQGRILAGGAPQSAAMGALPILYAATAAGVAGGVCIGPDGFLQRHGYPTQVSTSRRSHDPALAARLWQRSEQLTDTRFALER